MQAAAAGTGVRLSDGSTNVLPVGDADAVRAAWANHLRLVRRSLERGFYQGWDLHPAQLPTRFAATFAFFRGGLAPTRPRGCAPTSSRPELGASVPTSRRPHGAGRLPGARPRLRRAVDRARSRQPAGWTSTRSAGLARPAAQRKGAERWASSWVPTSTARPRTAWSGSTATPRATRSATSTSPPSLRGDFDGAHVDGDQSHVLPTDTQKNTAFAYAKEHGVTSPEDYAIALGDAGCSRPPRRRPAPGSRSRSTPGTGSRSTASGHDHAFVRRGGEVRTTVVDVTADGDRRRVRADRPGGAQVDRVGVQGLPARRVHDARRGRRPDPGHLADGAPGATPTRTAHDWNAAYDDVRRAAARGVRDDVQPRPAGDALRDGARRARGARPRSPRSRFAAPNKHHHLVDLSPFGLDNPGEVFIAADRPYGLIEATVTQGGPVTDLEEFNALPEAEARERLADVPRRAALGRHGARGPAVRRPRPRC